MNRNYAERLADFLPTNDQLDEFTMNPSTANLLKAFRRMTTWFGALYPLRSQEDTSVLIAAAHSKVIEVWILVPLGLLHSSYTALRSIVDICTSYTFYCSHPEEWLAVCEGRADWEGRQGIIEWHLRYNEIFRAVNAEFNTVDRLRQDYHELSSYVHAIPVTGIPQLKAIERQIPSDDDIDKFTQTVDRVNSNLGMLFLSVFHRELASLAAKDLREITRGIKRTKLANTGIVVPRV